MNVDFVQGCHYSEATNPDNGQIEINGLRLSLGKEIKTIKTKITFSGKFSRLDL